MAVNVCIILSYGETVGSPPFGVLLSRCSAGGEESAEHVENAN
jgi:hypothetical protein